MFKRENFHSHTKYSNNFNGHAELSPEEIVLKAIEAGFTTWGFTEHVPFKTVGNTHRTTMETALNYIKDVNEVKEKYKDKIKVLCGFECEAAPEEFELHNELLKMDGIDFLIQGNHFATIKDGILIPFANANKQQELWSYKEQTKLYLDMTMESVRKVKYSFLAHPDRGLPSENHWDKEIIDMIHEFLEFAKDRDIPLCVNVQAFKNFEQGKEGYYYHDGFWKMVAHHQNRVYVEMDYHLEKSFDMENWEKLVNRMLELGVNLQNR